MTQHRNAKWPRAIADLQADPGQWHKVAEDAGPSTIQRLRSLGAEVSASNPSPRTTDQKYSRYTVFARWPTPATELERVTLEHATLTTNLATAKADVDAAEAEYNDAKKILNRNAYRRKQAREKYEPMLDELDLLTSLLNRLTTEKD